MSGRVAQLFKQHDINGDGTINVEELASVFAAIGFTSEQSREMLLQVSGSSGSIRYEDFLKWLFPGVDLHEGSAANSKALPMERAEAPTASLHATAGLSGEHTANSDRRALLLWLDDFCAGSPGRGCGGRISEVALHAALAASGVPEAHISLVFERASLPSDGEGRISCQAFVDWVLSSAAPEVLRMQLLAAQPDQLAQLASAALGNAPDEDAAHFLTEAFRVLASLLADMEVATHGDADAGLVLRSQEQQLHEEFFDFIDQAFDHHDQMGSGVLDSIEARALFNHLMDVRGGFLSNLVAFGMYPRVKLMLQQRLQQDQRDTPPSAPALGSGMVEEVEHHRKSLSLQMSSALESYITNRAERDEALLQVISSAGDGTIQREDLKEVLTPGSERSAMLLRAFVQS